MKIKFQHRVIRSARIMKFFLCTHHEIFPFCANLLTPPKAGSLKKSTNIRKTVCNIMLIFMQYAELNY